MARLRASAFLVGTRLALSLSLSSVASAQTTITISMAEAPDAPRLQGPFVFGSTPDTPLLFAIPATGEAPLTFSASDLPAGLTLSASTGIITGTTPAAGSHVFTVSVTNAAGTASAPYTLAAGDTLAPTPPMGWNSYDSFGASVTEQDMIEQADAVRALLQPYGWNHVVIDYRWYESGQPIDANGRYLPNTTKYPSATGATGFKSLSDQIHAKGLRFGIHIMRGVPRKSYDENLPIAGSSYTTRQAGNTNDPCPWDEHMWGASGEAAAVQAWYDSLIAQYAAWGVDFIKIDDMLNNTTRQYHQAEADALHRAVAKTGRSILLSFSPGPDDPSWLTNSVTNLNVNAGMWRVVNDFWDYDALTDLPGVFRAANTWQAVSGLVAGHWPDLDMLPLGYLGPRNEWHASGATTFTRNEQVSILTLWSMLPSPLMYGGNPARLTDDAWTRALLTNEEVLAVNQDPLGAHGRRTALGSNEMWVRELSGGRKAVAFFNRGSQDTTLSATLSELGISETPTIRDAWQRSEVTARDGTLSADVPGGAALLFTLAPPGSTGGAGGAGGTAGSPGTGGSSGGGVAGSATSGAAGQGGASGATSAAGSSGTAGGVNTSGAGGTLGAGGTGTGGAGGSGTAGGSVSTAGGAGNGGVAAIAGAAGTTATQAGSAGATTTGDAPSSESGCGCSVPGRLPIPVASGALLLAALGALGLRRHGTKRARS
jgi:alpha-galactosidase